MENNKFTKEQFLLLAECEYFFCDNVEKIGDMLSGKSEDLKKEVLRLGKKAEEIMLDVVDVGRKRMEIGSKKITDTLKETKTIFLFENEIIESKRGGLFAIIRLYDELKKKEETQNVNENQ